VVINEDTKMLLFRYNNYKKTDFIEEHKKILKKNGYVWMLKVGKKASKEKLDKILGEGGWMVLRAPKADGSISYIARFSDYLETQPPKAVFPAYYESFLNGEDSYEFDLSSEQWFKIEEIQELAGEDASNLVLEKTGKTVEDVIGTTRTAVMYITNKKDIIVGARDSAVFQYCRRDKSEYSCDGIRAC